MAKKLKKFLSCILVLSICISALSIGVLAAEEPAEPGEGRTKFSAPAGGNGDGTGTADDPKLTVTETETVTKRAGGGTETTTVTEKSWTGRDSDPENREETDDGSATEVIGSETRTETVITDAYGSVTRQTGSISGQETAETVKTETKTENADIGNPESTTVKGTPTSTGETMNNPVNDGEAETAKPTTADAADPEIDFSGTAVELKPGESGIKTDVPGTITDEERDAILKGFGITDPDFRETLENFGTATAVNTDADEGVEITVTVSAVKDTSGTVVGYTKTVTTRKLAPTSSESKDTEKTAFTDSETGLQDVRDTADAEVETAYQISLPEKPECPENVENEDGSVTSTEVTEIYEEVGGKQELVGYRVTRETSKDGSVLSSESESVYGTVIITTVTTQPRSQDNVTKETVTVLTTENYSQTVVTSSAEIGIKNGTLTAGMGEVSVTKSKKNVTTIQPVMTNTHDGTANPVTQLYNRENRTSDTDNRGTSAQYSNFGHFWNGEYGIESMIRVRAGSAATWQPHQFVLEKTDGTGKSYVYCADFDVSPHKPWKYDTVNVRDADYYSEEDGNHIRAIALNGYWGTESGLGSLEAFKQMLSENYVLTEAELSALTDGQALTATQAAIWKYGNSGTSYRLNDNNIVGSLYNGSDFVNVDSKQAVAVQKIYEYLIGLSEEPEQNTTFLDAGTIRSSKITLNSENSDGSYNSDISFVLAVTPDSASAKTLRLTLTYKDASGTEQQVTEYLNKEGFGSEDGRYTFRNLDIGNNQEMTLTLDGVHTLETGVYLYTSEVRTAREKSSDSYGKMTSQTFVGVGKGSQEVSMNVKLSIGVTDPSASVTQTSSAQDQTVTKEITSVRTDVTTLTRNWNNITTVTDTVDRERLEWSELWDIVYHVYHSGFESIPGQETEEEKSSDAPGEGTADGEGESGNTDIADGNVPAASIFDGDVPAASVPNTGRNSLLWAVCCIFCGFCISCIALPAEKQTGDISE